MLVWWFFLFVVMLCDVVLLRVCLRVSSIIVEREERLNFSP